jgi:hypothetical protein
MSEDKPLANTTTNTFEPMWYSNELKSIDRTFNNIDFSSKLSFNSTDQEYCIIGADKQEVVKAETVADAMKKTQIKPINKIIPIIGGSKVVFLTNELSKSQSN